jgi:hypothetical protein
MSKTFGRTSSVGSLVRPVAKPLAALALLGATAKVAPVQLQADGATCMWQGQVTSQNGLVCMYGYLMECFSQDEWQYAGNCS